MLLRIVTLCALVGQIRTQSLANSLFAEAGTNAGFVTRINQKALDLLSGYLHDRSMKFLSASELAFNISAPLTNEVSFTISSNRLQSFDPRSFQSRMSIVPGKGVAWTGSNLNVTSLCSFSMRSPQGVVSGQVPLSFARTNVELLMWTGVNQDGHLKTDLVTCKVAANDIALQFSSSDSVLLANYLSHISQLINQRIEQVVCPTFHAELVPVISNRLMNSPMSAALFDHYFLNYALLSPVEFGSNAVVVKHRGNAFGILRQGRTRLNDFRLPFRSPALELDSADIQSSSGRMVDFYLSNYTLSSLLFWMDQYRKFDYEISRAAQDNSALQGYLRTECASDDICAGTLFPALATKYPKGEVVIKSHTVAFPRVALRKNNLTIFIDSRVDAFVQQPDRSRRFLTAAMNAEVKLDKMQFVNYVLHGNLRIEKFKISDVSSMVEGIDAGSLEFLVNALTELILNEDLSKKLKAGIQFPIMFDMEQSVADVVIEDDMMRISTDFCYGILCNQVAEQKDANVDYYDTVG